MFSTLSNFITFEISQANNIKNRVNRQCVERSLRMLKSHLKTINFISDKGVIFCFGIDENQREIFEIISPPQPINKFYYRCDRYFHLDQYNDMFVIKPKGYVVLADGNQCLIYEYSGVWKKLVHFDALLIKRQKKGGQSSLRFSRLAEESRMHYITKVVDTINRIIVNDNTANYIFGSLEIKSMILNNTNLKIKFKTESLYHSFTNDTIKETYFTLIMNNIEDNSNEFIIEEISLLLDTQPDILLFSLDEVKNNINNVEYVLVITSNEVKDVKCYKLPNNSKYYAKLKDFQIIGKLYYSLEINDTD